MTPLTLLISLILSFTSGIAPLARTDLFGNPIQINSLYHRAGLSDAEQDLYDRIALSARLFVQDVDVLGAVEMGRILDVLTAVRLDNPDIFWLHYGLQAFFYGEADVVFVRLFFDIDKANAADYIARFNAAAAPVLAEAALLDGDRARAHFVYHALAASGEYYIDADFNQSAFSAIVLGEAVCMGLALAFQFYMQQLGIDGVVLLSYVGDELHALNRVCLDGEAMYFDVTRRVVAGSS